MKYITVALVLLVLYSCGPNPCYHRDRCEPVNHIDWDKVPAETSRPPPKQTENQRALARERKRVYMALAFERVPKPEVTK